MITPVVDPQPNHQPTAELDFEMQSQLLHGEVLLKTRSHTAWGGAVTAQMYVPVERTLVWQQLTDYSRWVQFFPDMTHSEVRGEGRGYKHLYQAARKAFLLLSVRVEIYLKVIESVQATGQLIQFQLEKGNFHDFAAQLQLQSLQSGTLLTYSVQATPQLPLPTQLIQEAIRLDLPKNMRKMRQALCSYSSCIPSGSNLV